MSSDPTGEAVDAIRAAQVPQEPAPPTPEQVLEELNAEVDHANDRAMQLRVDLRLAERAQFEAIQRRDKYQREHFIDEEA